MRLSIPPGHVPSSAGARKNFFVPFPPLKRRATIGLPCRGLRSSLLRWSFPCRSALRAARRPAAQGRGFLIAFFHGPEWPFFHQKTAKTVVSRGVCTIMLQKGFANACGSMGDVLHEINS